MAASLRTLRRALALSLDDLGIQFVVTGSSTGCTFDLLANPTTGAATTTLNGRWVYQATGANAGQQRRVQTGGLTPSTGATLVYPDWAAPSLGDEMELTGLFPAINNTQALGRSPAAGDTDYRTIINRTLGRLLIPGRVTLNITTNDAYSLATWPWLNRPERLVRVLEPAITSGQRPVPADWRGWRLVVNGTTSILEVDAPFSTATGVITLEILRPANTLVSGVEATELVNEEATVDIGIEDFLPAAKAEAYAVLASRTSAGTTVPNAAGLAEFWRGEARKSRFWDRTSDVGQPAGEAA